MSWAGKGQGEVDQRPHLDGDGYVDGVDGAAITVVDGVTWGQPNQIEVEISDTVDTFLLRALGSTPVRLTELVPLPPISAPTASIP